MAFDDKAPNKGQQKLHPVTNPATGETRTVTQEQWKNRRNDPTLAGFERVDAPEADEPPDDGSVTN